MRSFSREMVLLIFAQKSETDHNATNVRCAAQTRLLKTRAIEKKTPEISFQRFCKRTDMYDMQQKCFEIVMSN